MGRHLAGCFQVSDNPEGAHLHFSPDEVAVVESVEDWVDRILRFLLHPEQANPFRERVRQRALAAHTWDHRAAEFVELAARALGESRGGAGTQIW